MVWLAATTVNALNPQPEPPFTEHKIKYHSGHSQDQDRIPIRKLHAHHRKDLKHNTVAAWPYDGHGSKINSGGTHPRINRNPTAKNVQFQDSVLSDDSAQLANVDLQNNLQKQQQLLNVLSTISKQDADTGRAVVRHIGG